MVSAAGAWTSSGESRTTRKPPALMMPACMKAETGVGVSIVSGSQLWKGNWADFNAAQPTMRKPTRGRPSVWPAATAVNRVSSSQVP